MKIVVIGLTALSTLAVSVALAPEASAFTQEQSCSVAGFTGTIDIQSDAGLVEYKINKGGNSGGNSANVNMTALGKVTKSPDNLRQDNVFHPLWSIGEYGSKGLNTYNFQIIFDRSGASDPSCAVSFVW